MNRFPLGLFACLTFLAGTVLAAADAEPPLELQPYRVLVRVAFAPDPRFTAEYRRGLLRDVAESARRVIGPMWSLTVEEENVAFSRSRLDPESLHAEFPEADFHKVFFLSAQLSGAETRLEAREWDARVLSLSLPSRRAAYDSRRLAGEAVELLRLVFRPLAVVDEVLGEVVHLRVQGGEFPSPDPEAAQVTPGDLLQVAFRYFNRERELQRVQFLPWTYLRVDEVERGRARCLLNSGLRSPLGGKQRGRIETLALVARPAPEPTRLTLVKLGRPDQPLIAHRVAVTAEASTDEEQAGEALRLLTDRWGAVEIPADPVRPLVWLSVHSGRTLLARLPFVPGVDREAVLELPDDSDLLTVDGRIALLRNNLVDTVARRALLMVQARKAAQAGKWDAVDERLAELRQLPAPRQYQAQLRTVCMTAINAAEARGDRVTAGRVRRLLEETNGLIDHYLDRDKLRLLEEELAELRKAAAEISAARPSR